MTRPVITREEAAAKGLKRYFTGEPCAKRGHFSERFTSNGGCIMCLQRLTPSKMQGPRGRNVGWPKVGLIFSVPDVTLDEMEAAFRFIEAHRWHDAAVMELRKNPALFEQFRTRMSAKEIMQLEAQLERARRQTGMMQDALLHLACGFSQLYYGVHKKVGDTERCNHCKTDQAIVRIE